MKTLFRFGISLNLLLVAGCTTTPLHEQVTARPPTHASVPVELLIISAVYGSGAEFADVTHRVNGLLRQPGVEFFARPEWLHADPTPGWNKALVIVYDFKGQRRIFTTGEGGRVTVECLIDPPEKSKKRLSEVLDQRKYRFDLKRFRPEFEKLTQADEIIRAKMQPTKTGGLQITSFNGMAIVNEAFAQLLKDTEGVTFEEPAVMFLNDRRGEVLVRGTPRQCEAVENLLVELNAQPVEIDWPQ